MRRRYRLTMECGGWSLISVVAYRRFLREALAGGWPRTRVPRGYVLTLPSGELVALLEER